MPACLLCGIDSDQLTDEHVFPAALGGTIVLRNGTCASCNNGLSTAEQNLSERMAHFRAIFQIPNRRGDVPAVETTLTIEGQEVEGRLFPDGTVQAKPFITVLRNEKGKAVEVIHHHVTPLQAERLKKELKPGWELFEESTPQQQIAVEGSLQGDLDFIESDEALRTAAKIAYSAMALRLGTHFAASPQFGNVRSFIQGGQPVARLFANERFLEQSAQGPHQHSVTIAGLRKRKTVAAIVRLFGALSYYVTLSDQYEGADFGASLILDAYRGEEVKMLASHIDIEILQIEDVADAKDTVWDDRLASGTSFLKSVNGAIERVSRLSNSEAAAGDVASSNS
jgi:hypothetical protein